MTLNRLITLNAYHAWANQRLGKALGHLPEADLQRPLGLFFSSLLGTLNHILVVDDLWCRALRAGRHAGRNWTASPMTGWRFCCATWPRAMGACRHC